MKTETKTDRLKVRHELKDMRFGMWKVIGISERTDSKRQTYWDVVCDCGNKSTIRGSCLVRGVSSKCKYCALAGCNYKHGESKPSNGKRKATKLYQVWSTMKSRCSNPSFEQYKWYGARGIKVCDRWANSYELFKKDVGERPVGCSLDRINNEGDYEPTNCKWSTHKEQANNRRRPQQ